jgi:uncharacterized protein (TIGR03663 family)
MMRGKRTEFWGFFGLKPFDRDKIIFWSILLAAFFFRFSVLSLKPPHADEGVNGFFVGQIWESGYFSYDPSNYHGPLLFYLFQISEKIFGFGVRSFRLVTASFSILTLLLVLRSGDILGRYGRYFAATALALSPGMIFFGRSAIHEPVFVFFQVLCIIGFMKLRELPEESGLRWFFVGLLGCLLLKETFVILGVSFLLAWGWTEFSPQMLDVVSKKVEPPPKRQPAEFTRTFLLEMIFVVVFIWLAFFTGFFHQWKGASDFFVALMPWLKTGVGGSGHEKPFYYWLQLFMRYEWIGAAGIAGAFMGVFSRSWKLRFLSVLGLANGLIYSLIPYKTPWCIISMLWPFVFIAGIWIDTFLIKKGRQRDLAFSDKQRHYTDGLPGKFVVVLAACLLPVSAVQSYNLNYRHYTDASEPYVYVQTKNDFKIIENIIAQKIKSAPNFRNMKIQVNLKESWPLPWFFSRFSNCGFFDYQTPFDLTADLIFTEVSRSDNELSDLYWRRRIELRDAREPINVYIKKSAFAGIELPGFSPFQPSKGQGA